MNRKIVIMLLCAVIGTSLPSLAQRAHSAKANDTAFVQKNIEDNMLEIELSEMAISKSTNDSLKALAGKLVTEHSDMLATLQGLPMAPGEPMMIDSGHIASQSGVATDSMDHGKINRDPMVEVHYDKDMKERKQALLKATGEEFDRQWLANMVGMHDKKLRELEAAVKTVEDNELKSAIQDAIPKVRAHAAALKAMAKDTKGKTQRNKM